VFLVRGRSRVVCLALHTLLEGRGIARVSKGEDRRTRQARFQEHPIAAIERLARLAGERTRAGEGDEQKGGASHRSPLKEVWEVGFNLMPLSRSS